MLLDIGLTEFLKEITIHPPKDFNAVKEVIEVILSEKEDAIKQAIQELEQSNQNIHNDNLATFCLLGFCYAKGIGVTKDKKKAFELYQLAANKGCVAAQINLGDCYRDGIVVIKDEKKALELYQLAANQGFTARLVSLGICYRDGTGVPKDKKKAFELFQLAANKGDAVAQCNLGVCYEKGRGVNKDEKRAAEFYQLAANQGFGPAQCKLADWYHQGIGMQKNVKEALKWQQKAILTELGIDYQHALKHPEYIMDFFQQVSNRWQQNNWPWDLKTILIEYDIPEKEMPLYDIVFSIKMGDRKHLEELFRSQPNLISGSLPRDC